MKEDVYIGVDIGSATIKVVGVTDDGEIIGNPVYIRHDQYPSQVDAVKSAFKTYLESTKEKKVSGIGITGSGRELNKHIIGADLTKTEIFAHHVGVQHLLKKGRIIADNNGKAEPLKKVGAIIEIGGQDSKVIIFDELNNPVYFNMNTICSAGTGEFLKQLADEAGIPLESFGDKALEAKQASRIDATCTVFSRRDFRHLTQKGVSISERLAGICEAMVNNFVNNVAKGQKLPDPIIFQGGVAFNKGVIKAFENRLGVKVYVPPHNDIIGALGMAIIVMEDKASKGDTKSLYKEDFFNREFDSQIKYCHGCSNGCELTQPLEQTGGSMKILDTLGGRCEGAANPKNVKEIPQAYEAIKLPIIREKSVTSSNKKNPKAIRSSEGIYFAGIDGGSRGTKYAVIKGTKDDIEIISVGTIDTSGDAIHAIMQALIGIEKVIPLGKVIGGIGTTGSAGELARDLITRKNKDTSDVKVTEIIAHTTWAQHMVPDVRVVMDIGGNDAKIIVINENGIQFAMNDKCAAGAGAFVEAIAKRFEVPLDKFGDIALTSKSPARISGRCAVFGETDMVHKAREGFPTKDLLMGLAYSICRTYLSDIGKGKLLSVPIVAQGGTFLNKAIQKAFIDTLELKDDEFIIAEDKRLVIGAGALGSAILAKEAYEKGLDSHFKGFDYILSSNYNTKTVNCIHPECDRSCYGVITLLENGIPIAGYKSINCDFGLFDGLIQSESVKAHIEKILIGG